MLRGAIRWGGAIRSLLLPLFESLPLQKESRQLFLRQIAKYSTKAKMIISAMGGMQETASLQPHVPDYFFN